MLVKICFVWFLNVFVRFWCKNSVYTKKGKRFALYVYLWQGMVAPPSHLFHYLCLICDVTSQLVCLKGGGASAPKNPDLHYHRVFSVKLSSSISVSILWFVSSMHLCSSIWKYTQDYLKQKVFQLFYGWAIGRILSKKLNYFKLQKILQLNWNIVGLLCLNYQWCFLG